MIIGHPDIKLTQLPVSEGFGHGNIKCSNQFPNDSHLTNWLTKEDYISWDVALEKEGIFEIEFYYACSKENIGTELSISFSNSTLKMRLKKKIMYL